MIPKYRIRCIGGGEIVPDTTSLSCPARHNSLLRTEYSGRRLNLAPHRGIFRYLCWLPVTHPLLPSGGPVTFTSTALSRETGLSRLAISFSGYCPEHEAFLTTGSFKELEALPTLQRLWELGKQVPVIASAGNTGRAFAGLSAQYKKPVVIVVPKDAVSRLWTTTPAHDIFLVAVDGDYTDAITVSNALACVPGCVPEGGAKNVARRDGMGTVMLDAAVTLGRIPDHYFQAVGSGTGAIAAWEAALRLIEDSRYGASLPRLHLAQNKPFTPMVSAWQQGRRTIDPDLDMPDMSNAIHAVMSPVLTNRTPPYGIAGGLFDALQATDGCMYSVSNEEGKKASQLIRDTVEIDPDPAAAIALAALMHSTETGAIGANDYILLNITGGGYERVREDYSLFPIKSSAVTTPGLCDDIKAELKEWISHYG